MKQLHQRERLALNNLDKLDEFDKNIQELTLLFLNANFLDGVEQNQDIGSFLFLLSNIQDGLCEKFYNFLKTIWSKTETLSIKQKIYGVYIYVQIKIIARGFFQYMY